MFSDKKQEKLGCRGASMPIPAKYRTEEMMELECSMKIFLRTSSISQIFCKENLKKPNF